MLIRLDLSAVWKLHAGDSFVGVPVSPPKKPTRINLPLLLAEAYLVMGPLFPGAEKPYWSREPINWR